METALPLSLSLSLGVTSSNNRADNDEPRSSVWRRSLEAHFRASLRQHEAVTEKGQPHHPLIRVATRG